MNTMSTDIVNDGARAKFEEWSRDTAVDLYKEEGERLEKVLFDSLPGGTYDQLLARMHERKASLFRVPFGGSDE